MIDPSRGATTALLAALCCAPAFAQGSLRIVGVQYRYDASAYDLPCQDLAVQHSTFAVLRTDDRIVALGAGNLPDGPPPPAGTSHLAVALGANDGYALRSDGAIVSWSAAGPGPLVPALPTGVGYVEVSASANHALARRSDGVAVAWGDNSLGQASVPALPPGITVTHVHAATNVSLLLLSDGSIRAFGAATSALAAVPALPPLTTYTRLWAGSRHALARRSDGTIVAWGDNSYLQCNVPALPAGVAYTHFAAGQLHTVAARSDGQLVAFGLSNHAYVPVPQPPAGAVVAELAAGNEVSFARFLDGSVIGWGGSGLVGPLPSLAAGEDWSAFDLDHRIHGLTSAGRVLPLGHDAAVTPLPAGMAYTAVASGSMHAVALRSDGRAFAWGSNMNGQCAIPPLPPGMTYDAVCASFARTVLLRSDGRAVEAGYAGSTIPAPPAGVHYVAVACHDRGTALLRSDGTALVLGDLGNNGAVPAPLPAGVRYTGVARGRYFAAALRSDGQIDTWGVSSFGAPLPPLPPGVHYVEVDAREDQFIARRSDGHAVGAAPHASYAIAVPAPRVGESYVAIAAGSAQNALRAGPTCTYTTFAPGCAGSRPASRLVPRDTPRVGSTLEVTLFDLPVDLAALAFGWNATAPIPLAPLGLPGCFQHVTVDAAVLLVGANAQAVYRLPIPTNAGLVGLVFHHQAIVFDSAANAAGAVVSDAATAVVGAP